MPAPLQNQSFTPGVGVILYLVMVESLFYTSTQSDWPPLSAEKISLSLSHLVPEILGPKVGLIFDQNVLFNRFKAFYVNFPLILYPTDPLFH